MAGADAVLVGWVGVTRTKDDAAVGAWVLLGFFSGFVEMHVRGVAF